MILGKLNEFSELVRLYSLVIEATEEPDYFGFYSIARAFRGKL